MGKKRIFTCNWTLLPVMDAVGAARFTAEQGFAGMELECCPLDFWPTTLPGRTVRELAAIGSGEGISYTVHAPDSINPATALPERRTHDIQVLQGLVELADRLSSPVVGIHPGVADELFCLERKGVPFDSERFDRRTLTLEARGRAVETIAAWSEICAGAGLVLTVENECHVRHSVAPEAAILAAMVEGTGQANVKVNLDTGHAIIAGGLAEEFAVLEKHIVHVHLDDGGTPGVSEHLPLGEGIADFTPLAGFLASFEGAQVLEIYAPDRPIEATLASREFLLGLLDGM